MRTVLWTTLAAAGLGAAAPASAAESHAAELDAQACAKAAPSVHASDTRGVAVIAADIRTYLEPEQRLQRGRAILMRTDAPGQEPELLTRSLQCDHVIVMPDLRPGRYRLVGLSGIVNVNQIQLESTSPDPNANYRIVNLPSGSDFKEYRVDVAEAAGPPIQIKAGEVTYAGRYVVRQDTTEPHATRAVKVVLEDSADLEARLDPTLRVIYPHWDGGLGGGGPETDD